MKYRNVQIKGSVYVIFGLDFNKTLLMKNKIFAILIAVAATLVCAQSEPTIAKPASREHRGFYSNMSFGAAYNWYNSSQENYEEWNSDYEKKENHSRREIDLFEFYGGTFPTFEFKFGTALANLIAFHTVFNLGIYAGVMDYYYEEYQKDCEENKPCKYEAKKDEFEETSSDAYNFRTYLGFGTTIYPFRDKTSLLNGFFVGGSYGYSMFATMIMGGNEDACVNFGYAFQVEMGKEWWVNDHMSIGVGLGYARTNLVWQTISSHSSDNVLSLSFRLTRG